MEILTNGDSSAPAGLLLAHGAGAPYDSDFMNQVAEYVANQGIYVGRFEFPYMSRRREDGRKRPPDREPVLRTSFREAYDAFHKPTTPCFIGGKSMGGRLATLVAADGEIEPAGVICWGYPFHPTGRPEKLRVEHLKSLSVPTLILQGERDPFGNREEFSSFGLDNPRVTITWFADGNHDLRPRKASGLTHKSHLAESAQVAGSFIVAHGT